MAENKKRIIFVDDEPNILSGLRRSLRELERDYELQFSMSGTECLELMAKKPFDMVVSDMRMPKMDGSQLLQEIMNKYPTVVRVILSGHAEEECVLKAIGIAHQYLSKPCEYELLKNVIVSSLSLKNCFESEAMRSFVSKIKSLPSAPDTYVKLTKELRSGNPVMEKIATIVEDDIGMSSKILQLVNSAFFGLPRHISNIRQAVTFLGMETIKTLVLSLGVFSSAQKGSSVDALAQQLSRHSLIVTSYLQNILKIENIPQAEAEELYVAGMLHDIGMLIFSTFKPVEYQKIREDCTLSVYKKCEEEKKLFNVSHPEVGAYLLSMWGLRNQVIEPIYCHHNPEKCPNKDNIIVPALYFAEILSHCPYGTNVSEISAFMKNNLDFQYLNSIGVMPKIEQWFKACIEINPEEKFQPKNGEA